MVCMVGFQMLYAMVKARAAPMKTASRMSGRVERGRMLVLLSVCRNARRRDCLTIGDACPALLQTVTF